MPTERLPLRIRLSSVLPAVPLVDDVLTGAQRSSPLLGAGAERRGRARRVAGVAGLRRERRRRRVLGQQHGARRGRAQHGQPPRRAHEPAASRPAGRAHDFSVREGKPTSPTCRTRPGHLARRCGRKLSIFCVSDESGTVRRPGRSPRGCRSWWTRPADGGHPQVRRAPAAAGPSRTPGRHTAASWGVRVALGAVAEQEATVRAGVERGDHRGDRPLLPARPSSGRPRSPGGRWRRWWAGCSSCVAASDHAGASGSTPIDTDRPRRHRRSVRVQAQRRRGQRAVGSRRGGQGEPAAGSGRWRCRSRSPTPISALVPYFVVAFVW